MKNFGYIFLTLCVVCMVALCGTVIQGYAQEAPQTNVQLPENVPGSDAPVQELSPQDKKETPKPDTVTGEPKVIKKAESSDAVKNEEKRQVTASDATTQKADAAKVSKVDSKSLLSITEGAFRYSRIPGITIKENNEQIIAKIVEEKTSVDTEEKGLFGLSKKASDRMAKIILVVIIIFVFILYRMRTRSTSGSVLRRFPK